jgi:hypothetical protein
MSYVGLKRAGLETEILRTNKIIFVLYFVVSHKNTIDKYLSLQTYINKLSKAWQLCINIL